MDKVLRLHLLNKISAEDCCTTLHLAVEAGVSQAKRYALGPGSSSGHYSRKLTKALALGDSRELYEFEYPGHSKHELSRTVHKAVCIPFHEQISADMEEDVGCRVQLADLVRERVLPPVYWQHKVVRAATDGERVLPVALYLDGVPYSQNDSVIGWWAVNLITGRRYLWGLLRKSKACRCGCRFWDSVFIFLQVAVWSLQALAEGCFPAVGHDGSPLQGHRAGLAGSRLACKAACIYVKGDWSEFCGTLGLPTWQDGIRPCYLCAAHGEDQFVVAGNREEALRWPMNTEEDYRNCCQRCLRRVRVKSVADRDAISRKLRYDKRQNGNRGRCMTDGLDAFGLFAGDRLEPTARLPDVAGFDSATPPFSVDFWRTSEESATRRPNPLFLADVGISVAENVASDSLHAVYLGVMRVWARVAVWTCLLSGVFGGVGTAEENVATGILAFRSMLMSWYKTRHKERPGERLTRLADFNAKLIGTASSQVLKSKGAETYGLMKFLLHLYGRFQGRLGDTWQRLLKAGLALERVVTIWQEHDWIIPPARRQEALDEYGKHVALMQPFNVYTPKHHIVFHLVQASRWLGNPAKYSTWKDEALNKVLKSACRHACAARFDTVVLLRMRELLRDMSD